MVPESTYQAVADKKISRDAGWLYSVLLRHRNRKRGTDTVWPTREVLAFEMGIAKASNVDKYLKQLETAGFVLITHQRLGRMKTRNVYTLLHIPSSARSPNFGTTERPAETQETAGGDDSPNLGLRSPESGTPVVPKLGPEPYEVLPKGKTSSSARSSCRDRIAVVTGADDDEINLIIEQIKNATTGTVRNLGALIASISDDDIRDHHEAVVAGNAERAAASHKADLADLRRQIGTYTECPDQIKGGWFPHPDTGLPWFCGACRVRAERDPDQYEQTLNQLMKENGL
jgi:hypothetical protein